MRLRSITMALAFVAGTVGLSGAATAQDRGPPPSDQSIRHDGQVRPDQARHDDVRRDVRVRREVRHYERHDRRSWGHSRRCRTVWRHHHRVRRCW